MWKTYTYKLLAIKTYAYQGARIGNHYFSTLPRLENIFYRASHKWPKIVITHNLTVANFPKTKKENKSIIISLQNLFLNSRNQILISPQGKHALPLDYQ